MEGILETISRFITQLGNVLWTIEKIVFFTGVAVGALATCLLVWAICSVVANMHIFRKAGQGGWKSLVPIYNNYITYKISWKPRWFWISALLLAASAALDYFAHHPVLDAIAIAVSAAAALIHLVGLYRLAKAFGHGLPFTLGLIFLHPVFILILGLGGSAYRGNACNGRAPAPDAPAPVQ